VSLELNDKSARAYPLAEFDILKSGYVRVDLRSLGKGESTLLTFAYNEITVPVGQDPIGAYYMANGFSEGYFGIQVNSVRERRVLFWTEVKPDGNGSTVYTSWFGDRAFNEWRIIASFRRPKTDKHITGFHFFWKTSHPITAI